MARTVVSKLGNFFAIFIFPAYLKKPEPSTNAPVAPTALNDTPSTDTPAGMNQCWACKAFGEAANVRCYLKRNKAAAKVLCVNTLEGSGS